MKTNPLFLFTTVLLCSGASLSATDKLCGGADDDQIFGAASLCGGADDDQFTIPVARGITSDSLGIHPGSASTAQPPVCQGITSDTLGLLPPLGPGPAHPPQPPVLQGLVTDPLGVMAMWNVLTGPAPVFIPGGTGMVPVPPARLTDAQILQVLATGSFVGSPVPPAPVPAPLPKP